MDSGRISQMPLAVYDPDSLSLRTCQRSLFEDLTESSPTLPRSGSMRNGRVYERPISARPTGENGYSSSLLPTPAAGNPNDGESPATWLARAAALKEKHRNGNGVGMPLAIAIQLLPTPRALDSTGVRGKTPNRSDEANARAGTTLTDVVLLPTPRTTDTNGPGKHGTGGPDLRTVADRLLPTPRARDHKGRDPNPRGVDLNEAVALLPTPRATDGTKGGPNSRGSSGDPNLPMVAVSLLPTPAACDWKDTGNFTPRPEKIKLPHTVALLPTPTVADADGTRATRGGQRSNELLLTGIARQAAEGKLSTSAPTSPPSTDGPASSDAPPPTPQP